jgi:hypothetical protein
MTGREPGRNGTLVLVGLVLLWLSALASVPLESGDCGGSLEACAAAATVAQGHVRLLVVTVLLITVIGIASRRTGHAVAHAALLASSAAIVCGGLWVVVAQNQRPEWLPVGFMLTIPAALLLVVGAARLLLASRAVEGDRPG